MLLTDRQILDLTTGTLENMDPMSFVQIAQPLQEYEVMPRWLKKDKVVIDGGKGITRSLMIKLSYGARHVGMYEKDNVNVTSFMKTLSIPWRHATNNWAYDRREILMNEGDGKLMVFKLIEPRRGDCMISFADELERKAWVCPAADNEKDPYGIPYYIVKNAAEGFNGGAPSGHTTVAGVNPTSVEGWKNYTGTYTNKSKRDLISKLRTAYRRMSWKSPVNLKDYTSGRGDKMRIYVNEPTINELELIGESQNDNLGNDLASKDDTIVFKKHPIRWIPILDLDTQDPVYFVDHGTFYPVVLEGDFLRESDPMIIGDQHNMVQTHVDLTYNYLCINRRKNGVLYKA